MSALKSHKRLQVLQKHWESSSEDEDAASAKTVASEVGINHYDVEEVFAHMCLERTEQNA